MTLTELRYIVAVARECHFGRAAEACFVSQPTLSVAVKKLEDELGVTLFERAKNEIRLTPIGEQIIAQAQRTLDDTAAIKEMAQQAQDPLHGSIRLGAIYTIGPYLFPALILVLRASAPQMPMFIEENYTARLADRLKRGELDAIIVALPFEDPTIETQALYDEPFVVVMPSGHPWRERESIKIEELDSQTVLLLGAGHCFRDQVISACPACDDTRIGEGSMQKSVEGGSLETIRHMVASGIGITILPCTAAGVDRYEQRLLVIRRFDDPPPSRRVALAWRKRFPRPAAIETLREAIVECNPSCVSFVDTSEPAT